VWDWWLREENDQIPAEQFDHAFRSLVLPGVARVLELEIDLPATLSSPDTAGRQRSHARVIIASQREADQVSGRRGKS